MNRVYGREHAHAFDLDGNGPRFLQDFEDLVSATEPIERLLIEAPGASTIGKSTDLLVHRDRVTCLGRPAAAIALFTFQSWAPAGGAGNRTGLRGGGPLSTFVLPGARNSLWHMLWANVPYGEPPDASELTRKSARGQSMAMTGSSDRCLSKPGGAMVSAPDRRRRTGIQDAVSKFTMQRTP